MRRFSGGKRRGASIPMAVLRLKGEQPCAPAFARDARTLGRNLFLRCIGEVAKHLPADRGIGVQQPGDDVHHQPSSPENRLWPRGPPNTRSQNRRIIEYLHILLCSSPWRSSKPLPSRERWNGD